METNDSPAAVAQDASSHNNNNISSASGSSDLNTTSHEIERILSHQRDQALRGLTPNLSSMQQEIERRGLFENASEQGGRGIIIVGGDEPDDEIDPDDESKSPEQRQRARAKIERARERELLRLQLSDEDNARIDQVVSSIEIQEAIKEMQNREMDLMRLTGAEMEDMWERRDEYRYSEYRKLMEAEAAAKAADAQKKAAENGEDNDGKIIAGSASGVNMRRSALLERAAKREMPKLFQIVAEKPPPVRDFPALRGHLIVDELPPDPEIHEISADGSVVPAGHSALLLQQQQQQQQQYLSQDELRLLGKLKVPGTERKEEEGLPPETVAEKKKRDLEYEIQQQAVRAHRISQIAAGKDISSSSSALGTPPPRHPSSGKDDDVIHRDEDGKEIEIDPSAGAAAAGAVSPHLFDCFRHARHRAVFSEAMKKRREEKGEEGGAGFSSTFQQLMIADESSKHSKNGSAAVTRIATRIAQPSFIPVSMSGSIGLPSSVKIFEQQRKKEEKKLQKAVDAAVGSLSTSKSSASTTSGRFPHDGGSSASLDELGKAALEATTSTTTTAAAAASSSENSSHADLKKLIFEQRVLLRKAEKDDSEKYEPLLRRFVEHNESVAQRMWG